MSRAGRLKALAKDNGPLTGTALGCGLGRKATGPNAAETPDANNRKGHEPRLTWALLRGLRLRRPASGPNLFVADCPVGVEDESTRHRLTVRLDDSRGYRVYLVNCFPIEGINGGHEDADDYDLRLADILRALGLQPRDLYGQTLDHYDGACEWTAGRSRRTGACGRAGYRLDVERLQHYALSGLSRTPVLCLTHAAEVTETTGVLFLKQGAGA